LLNLKEGDYLWDPDGDGRIILNQISKKWGIRKRLYSPRSGEASKRRGALMNAGDNDILNQATLNSYFVETSQTIIFSVLLFQFHNQ
jgi:hypothetical protein